MRGKICTLNVEGQHRESWGTPLTNPHHRMPEVYPLRTMRSPRTKVSEDESRLANKAKPFIDDGCRRRFQLERLPKTPIELILSAFTVCRYTLLSRACLCTLTQLNCMVPKWNLDISLTLRRSAAEFDVTCSVSHVLRRVYYNKFFMLEKTLSET